MIGSSGCASCRSGSQRASSGSKRRWSKRPSRPLPLPDPPQPTTESALVPVTPATPTGKQERTGLAFGGEAFVARTQLVKMTRPVNERAGPLVRRILVPAARTFQERILPMLGDFRTLMRFNRLLVASRLQRWETVEIDGELQMQLVEQGPSWLTLIQHLEAGERLDTLESVYPMRVSFPELTVNLLMEVYHTYCGGNRLLFDDFFETIEDRYGETSVVKRPSLVYALVHEINERFGGSLEEWLQRAQSLNPPTPIERAEQTSRLPEKLRRRREFSLDIDPENRDRAGNYDLGFDPERTRLGLRGRHV